MIVNKRKYDIGHSTDDANYGGSPIAWLAPISPDGAGSQQAQPAVTTQSIPDDTSFGLQWHLLNTVVGEYDLDVVGVWDEFTGAGVNVFVLDTGIDTTNPDLANIDLSMSHDYYGNDSDPSAVGTTENHGTAVAGIIGAARDGEGVVGVAYGAHLVHYRVGETNAPYAATNPALSAAIAAGADVVSMSFGAAYNYELPYEGATNFIEIFEDGVTTGREGLGTIMVKAAGNSRASNVDLNAQRESANTDVIYVAATNRNGTVSSYSTPGAQILVAGFGSGNPGEVVTTDRMGGAGYSSNAITTTFNGTSAATPMVAAIAALMLEANGDLGWRDVQTIMAYTARHVGSDVGGALIGSEKNAWAFNGATNWNGGGLHFSNDYGYGLIDARAAVRLAESWTAKSTSANEQTASAVLVDLTSPQTLGDGDLNGLAYSTTLAKAIDVEHVAVTVTFSAQRAADFELYVTGPDGQKHTLIADVPESGNYYVDQTTYTFVGQQFHGETGKGDWQVQVVDDQSGYVTTISKIELTVTGSKATANDTYIYTDEFSDYAGNGHATALKDTNGGIDTLNAAAATAAVVVDLTKGTGSIDGVSMKISGIENVFAGDANDKLGGNGSANDLAGGRGADVLAGGKGNDDFIFHVITDSLAGALRDIITDFGLGKDRIDLSDIDTRSDIDGDQAFRFIGGKGFHGRATELNYDQINKSGTRHDMTVIAADIDGDKQADFEIQLTGLHKLTGHDFFL